MMSKAKQKNKSPRRRQKSQKKNRNYRASIRKFLPFSKKDRQTIKLALAITIGILLALLLFHLCTDKNSYAGRSFYANEQFNLEVMGKEMYDLHGLDISHYQGKLDWTNINKHKINDKPISFVFLKASEGANHQDKYYAYNQEEAKKLGFICGAYHYYKDNVSADAQAKHFIQTAKLRVGDLAPVLDVEELDKDNKEQSLKSILRLMSILEKHYGTKPIFYTYDYLYRKYFRGTELDNYPLWIANYSLADEELPPYNWSFWQYSSRGRLNNCPSDFDLNVFRSSIKHFKALLIK